MMYLYRPRSGKTVLLELEKYQMMIKEMEDTCKTTIKNGNDLSGFSKSLLLNLKIMKQRYGIKVEKVSDK